MSLPKKRAKRYCIHAPLQYRIIGDRAWHIGATSNISESGILFTGSVPLAIDSRVEVHLSLPVQLRTRAGVFVTFHATIIRCEGVGVWAARIFACGIRRSEPSANICPDISLRGHNTSPVEAIGLDVAGPRPPLRVGSAARAGESSRRIPA